MSEPDEPRSGIDLRPDGGMHLWIDGKKIRLRSVRLRDYRALVGQWRDSLDEVNELTGTATAWLDEVTEAATKEDRGWTAAKSRIAPTRPPSDGGRRSSSVSPSTRKTSTPSTPTTPPPGSKTRLLSPT